MKIMEVLISTLLFSALIPVIASSIAGITNVTGAALILVGLTVLFVTIGFVVYLMKRMGIKVGSL